MPRNNKKKNKSHRRKSKQHNHKDKENIVLSGDDPNSFDSVDDEICNENLTIETNDDEPNSIINLSNVDDHDISNIKCDETQHQDLDENICTEETIKNTDENDLIKIHDNFKDIDLNSTTEITDEINKNLTTQSDKNNIFVDEFTVSHVIAKSENNFMQLNVKYNDYVLDIENRHIDQDLYKFKENKENEENIIEEQHKQDYEKIKINNCVSYKTNLAESCANEMGNNNSSSSSSSNICEVKITNNNDDNNNNNNINMCYVTTDDNNNNNNNFHTDNESITTISSLSSTKPKKAQIIISKMISTDNFFNSDKILNDTNTEITDINMSPKAVIINSFTYDIETIVEDQPVNSSTQMIIEDEINNDLHINTVDLIDKSNDDCLQEDKEDNYNEHVERIIHSVESDFITTLENYRVDSPKTTIKKPVFNLASIKKSRSLDDTDLTIQELSESSSTMDSFDNTAIVQEIDSEVESTDDEKVESANILGVHALPLDEKVPKSKMTKEEEQNLRGFLHSLNIQMGSEDIEDSSGEKSPISLQQSTEDFKSRRAKKRAAIENHFMPQFLNPRYLDIIKEENSDTSDVERKSEINSANVFDDFEDDIFIDKEPHNKKANAIFPKTTLDFSTKKKHASALKSPKSSAIREEPICVLLDTKIKVIQPEEGCSTFKTAMEKECMEAEIVYLESGSSSASDLQDLDYNDADKTNDILEDTHVNIATPIIDFDPMVNAMSSLQNEYEKTNEYHNLIGSEENKEIKKTESQDSMKIDENKNILLYDKSECVSTSEINIGYSIFANEDSNANIFELSEDESKIVDGVGSLISSANSPPDSLRNYSSSDIDTQSSNPLFYPTTSDTESYQNFIRHDSVGSISSSHSYSTSHSQCTAHFLEPSLSQTDISELDLAECNNVSGPFVDVFSRGLLKSLRQLCVEQLVSMPYGNTILEELANVAESLNDLTNKHQSDNIKDMPYPLPELPVINEIDIQGHENQVKSYARQQQKGSFAYEQKPSSDATKIPSPPLRTPSINKKPPEQVVRTSPNTIKQRTPTPPVNEYHQQSQKQIPCVPVFEKLRSPPPPPIPEPPSMEAWIGIPTKDDPQLIVCLSPSQRQYVDDQSKTVDNSPETLLDNHTKFIERRGYHEYDEKYLSTLNNNKNNKQNKTAEAPKREIKMIATLPNTTLPNQTNTPIMVTQAISEETNLNENIECNETNAKDNNNRLLAIIRDSSEQSASENSRDNKIQNDDSSTNNNNNKENLSEEKKMTTINYKSSANENYNTLNKLKTIGKNLNDFDECFEAFNNAFNKRFSNIETSNTGINTLDKSGQTKRYSNFETTSYETKKHIENGNVVFEYSDSKNEKIVDAHDGSGPQKVKDEHNVKSTTNLEYSPHTIGKTTESRIPKEHTNVKLNTGTSDQQHIIKNRFINTAKNKTTSNTETSEKRPTDFRQARSEFFDRDDFKFKEFDFVPSMFGTDFDSWNKRMDDVLKTFNTKKETFIKNSPLRRSHGSFFNEEFKETPMFPFEAENKREPLIGKMTTQHSLNEKRLSAQNLSDWMTHANRASSVNITKPISKEELICRGQRNVEVRAPRMTSSTTNVNESDISSDEIHHYMDTLQSRRNREMLVKSMIDNTPITNCVSNDHNFGRRMSLPRDIHERQLEYIRHKERELQLEFERLENDRKRLEDEMFKMKSNNAGSNEVFIPIRQESFSESTTSINKNKEHYKPSQGEIFRQQMHDEWLNKVAEREERRLHKIIKISTPNEDGSKNDLVGGGTLKKSASKNIGDEFLTKVKERRSKLSMPSDSDWESGAESQPAPHECEHNQSKIDPEVKVVVGRQEADPNNLPKHLKEFLQFTTSTEETIEETTHDIKDGIWSPHNKSTENNRTDTSEKQEQSRSDPPTSPIWTPRSAGTSPTVERKEFRPVPFESPVLNRKTLVKQNSTPILPPWSGERQKEYQANNTSTQQSSGREVTSTSTSNLFSSNSNLPRVQNPTITLLQKAREGQLPKRDTYMESERPRAPITDQTPGILRPNEVIYSIKNEYISEPESENEQPKIMADLTPRKYEIGIGPTTKDGMPLVLRSEVKLDNQSKWYKRMYNTLHKAKDDDDTLTVRYKTRRGRYPYKTNGYMSEPEPFYDSDSTKYKTLNRKAPTTKNRYEEYRSYGTLPTPVKSGLDTYKNQPGRIENYQPGKSSISEKEAKQWWDEVMDIFDGHLEHNQKLPNNYAEGYLSRAFKEQGYESDSSLIFRKRENSDIAPLSPVEQKQVYRNMQSGGEPPLQGFRKLAPEKTKDDSEIEYFPITSTLTKIRVHKKNSKLNNSDKSEVPLAYREVVCYPITKVTRPIDMFGSFPKNVKSFVPINPPAPPNRKSSKSNSTLKMFSDIQIKCDTSPGIGTRHEACFNTERKFDNHFTQIRSKSAGPYISTSLLSSPFKDEKDLDNITRIARRQIYRMNSSSSLNRSKSISESRKSSPSPIAFGRSISKERTFAEEKKRLEQVLPRCRKDIPTFRNIFKNNDLKSPIEVKRAIQNSIRSPVSKEKSNVVRSTNKQPSVGTLKSSTTIYSEKKSPNKTSNKKDEKSLRVTVAISSRGKELLRTSTETSKYKGQQKNPVVIKSKNSGNIISTNIKDSKTSIINSNLSLARTGSTYSIESSNSKRRVSTTIKPRTITRSTSKEIPIQINSVGSIKGKQKKVKQSKDKQPAFNTDSNVKNLTTIETASQSQNHTNYHVEEMSDCEYLNKSIMEHKDVGRTDCFFRSLFLRNTASPTLSNASSCYRNTSVVEKARLWNSLTYKSEPSLQKPSVYLSQKRPVTLSKFKMLERERTRSLSPDRIFRPSRLIMEQINKFDSIYQLSDEDDQFVENKIEQSISRGRNSLISYSYQERSQSEPPKTIVTDIARPILPIVIEGRKTYEVYPGISTMRGHRSPSSRRIQSFKNNKQKSEKSHKVIRARSLGSSDGYETRLLNNEIIEYSRSSLECLPYTASGEKKSDRFRELNKFYANLERVGQLERTTSSTDLRPRRRDEEIIDFDLWKRVRAHERAERELNYLVGKLKQDQKNKDFLFRPKDVEDIRWSVNHDSGLRIKEKSVEDLKEVFKRKSIAYDSNELKRIQQLEANKDTYKSLWRGNSVIDSASSMTVKYNPSEYPHSKEHKMKEDEKRFGFSNKLISTLSKDQINTIKHQLNEIYSICPSPIRTLESYDDIVEKYIINVPSNAQKMNSTSQSPTGLSVKPPILKQIDIKMTESDTEINEKAQKISNNQIEVQTKYEKSSHHSLSEAEKRSLSLTLSRELKDKIIERKQSMGSPIILAKETRGAIAAEHAKNSLSDATLPHRMCYSLDSTILGDNLNCDMLQNTMVSQFTEKHKLQNRLSASSLNELNTIDSKVTQQSIIPKQKVNADIRSKIKYFETRKMDNVDGTTIYHAREDSSPDENEIINEVIKNKINSKKYGTISNESNQIKYQSSQGMSASQSLTDLKDLFGEKRGMQNCVTSTQTHDKSFLQASLMEPRQNSLNLITRTSDACMSSSESAYRSRSISSETEKRCNSHMKLIKTGDVQKLRDKFEITNIMTKLRRIRSDPEINKSRCYSPVLKNHIEKQNKQIRNHELGDVSLITHKFEVKNASSRGRSRTRKVISPIPKVPLNRDARFMPHIDIISKTALLNGKIKQSQPQMTSLRGGEVDKIKNKFESIKNMSLLGQMYTSVPDVSELKDIVSHLNSTWIAHKYPKPQDNARTITSPEKSPPDFKLKRRNISLRSNSASPPRLKSSVASILKPFYDIFANQKFDPLIHRPKYRYTPDKHPEADFLWKKINQSSANTGINGKHIKPTVKFEEPAVVPPPPPPKGVPFSVNNQNPESPHRYIESDVNIHYRSPIRYEYKDSMPENELARQQAESMKKIYQEERRRKYLQELQDMTNRRHTDNFTPSQKSPISLNRYDDFPTDFSAIQQHQLLPKTIAKALYNFQGQSNRELSFKKGDIIYIRRQIDANWYEGEHNANVGLLPSNYIEIISKDGVRVKAKKQQEGQARAKYNFSAQSAIELSLNKGELVTLTRRVDDNWFEGRIANRKGIFPVAYVEVLTDIGFEENRPTITSTKVIAKPVGSPAAHSLITLPNYQQLLQHQQQQPDIMTERTTHFATDLDNLTNGHNHYTSQSQPNGLIRESKSIQKTEVLHVDTNSEPIAFRALYKYAPQNTDELELHEGDIVYVLEKCDDGWYVGTSQRTGYFGTFPGNYVEKL